MLRLLRFTFLFVLLAPLAAFAKGEDEIPKTPCDPEMMRVIYQEERGELMTMIKVHFVDGDKSVTDEEMCEQIETKFEGGTEADACPGGPDCPLPDPKETSDPDEADRSGVSRTHIQAVTSHIERPVTVTPQGNTRNNGGFFNNPFWGGALAGALIGGIGGYMLGKMTGNNNQQYANYPPPYNPYGPYGRPPFQPPGIIGPMQPPWMMQQPGQPFQYPYSGGMNGMPGYNMGMNYGQMPSGYPQGPGAYYPYQGNSYYGSLPAYYYNGSNGGYPYGTGYNPYAPPILPMPQAAR